mmetsp:Transcript_45467/g.120042  ORF Transcript_45467/g.120042 Transcript_45467/m.120042 type:complete len:1214 (-) Transcript_45467:186-3827(-)
MADGPPVREVVALDQVAHFCSNVVITSRYTILNFPFKNLYEQFQKPANVYFLVLTILQTFKEISITNGVPTIVVPLFCVLVLQAAKDGYEDYRKHLSDNTENDRQVQVYNHQTRNLEQKRWAQLKVGDIVCIRNREFIPADVVMLASNDPYGIVFIETAGLDGETNLKLRQSHKDSVALLGSGGDRPLVQGEAITKLADMVNREIKIQCQPPNKFIYSFEGTMEIGNANKNGQVMALEIKQTLLRGCKLRNTEWVLGVIVYSGQETKIQMNLPKPPHKASEVEKLTAKSTGVIFLIQIICCTIAGVSSASFETSDDAARYTYLGIGDSGRSFVEVMCLRFLTFILIFGNFIPISLIVTMGMVKVGQSFFMFYDEEMKHTIDGVEYSAVPRTTDLNEELGLVDYVFSDKTGTLTCNIMEFRKCIVNGKIYGKGVTEIARNVLRKQGKAVPEEPQPDPNERKTPNVNFVDPELRMALDDQSSPNHRAVQDFFRNLAINHEVMPETDGADLKYSSSSPDEGALVYGARHFGFQFMERNPDGIVLAESGGNKRRVRILATMEFSSKRKRSSVVCRYELDGVPQYWLYSKGADSVMQALLSPKSAAAETTKQTWSALSQFAADGLRTLVICQKKLTEQETTEWLEQYKKATMALDNRSAKIEEAAELIEDGLELVGGTAIEDRLQDGVGQTISDMLTAGIKVWMLTGDRVDTAINIGMATDLLNPTYIGQDKLCRVFDWSEMCPAQKDQEIEGIGDKDELSKKASSAKIELQKAGGLTEQELAALQNKIEAYNSIEPSLSADLQLAREAGLKDEWRNAERRAYFKKQIENVEQAEPLKALVVDGTCLGILLDEAMAETFVKITKECETVICCRVSPDQKGLTVRTIRKHLGSVALGIGDGANDCNMIQSANVGVGIRGEEGLQAFNCSDYGVSQFRFLRRLLLAHGRWNNRRISKVVVYMFYKNVVCVLPQFFLGFYSQFSGQKLYVDLMYQAYNVLFTFFPILILGILDQDVSAEKSLATPQLYSHGVKRRYLSVKVLMSWMANGVFQAAVVFFVPFFAFGHTSIPKPDGRNSDLWEVGAIVYFLVIVVVNGKVLLESQYITNFTWFFIGVSLGFWIFCSLVLSQANAWGMNLMGSVELNGSLFVMLSTPSFWLVTLFVVTTSLARDVWWKAFRRSWGQLRQDYHAAEDEERQEMAQKRSTSTGGDTGLRQRNVAGQ